MASEVEGVEHLERVGLTPPGVIARLDPKSGLPNFGIKLSKSETSDFDAIQYLRPVVTGSPGQAGHRGGVNLIEKWL
jgi:hypothetical protein